MLVLFRLTKARKGSASTWLRSVMRVDAGTSIALAAQAREDFHEQTALEAVIAFLRQYGCPRQLTFDRDPRWVGGVSGRDFPSPLLRLLLCLRITPHICPPHRPDKNAYVERFHRTYGQECLQVHQPSTLLEVREVTEAFLQHYNHERPHQGRSCGNVPPRVAFPTLPTLPALPERVDPDAWLVPLDQKVYLRHVGRDGCADVDLATYYLGPQMAGWSVLFQVEAQSRQFAVWHQDQVVKLLPIKGLVGQEMALADSLQYILQEAASCSATFFYPSVQESPTAASLGGGSLISSFIRQLSQALAFIGASAGKLLSPGFPKTRETRNHLLHE
jgi:Integrase core domain